MAPSRALIALLLAAAPAGADWLVKGPTGWALQLPPAAQAIIQARFPGFEPWKVADYHPQLRKRYKYSAQQAPFAVVADLNHDKVDDLVVEGHTAQQNLQLALISDKGSWRLYERESSPRREPSQESYDIDGVTAHGWWVYLELAEPGKYFDIKSDKEVTKKYPGYSVVYFGKAAQTFFFERGAFRKIITGD